jgi:hypothetical protein
MSPGTPHGMEHPTSSRRRLPPHLLYPHLGISPHPSLSLCPFTHILLHPAAHARTLPSTPTAAPLRAPSRGNAIGAATARRTTSLAFTRSSGPPASNSTTPSVRPPLASLPSPPSIPASSHPHYQFYPGPPRWTHHIISFKHDPHRGDPPHTNPTSSDSSNQVSSDIRTAHDVTPRLKRFR